MRHWREKDFQPGGAGEQIWPHCHGNALAFNQGSRRRGSSEEWWGAMYTVSCSNKLTVWREKQTQTRKQIKE